MKLLLRQVWSCLIEQVILISFKNIFSQNRRSGVSEHRTADQVSLPRWKQWIGFQQSFLTFCWMILQTFILVVRWSELVELLLQTFPVHHITDMDLHNKLRSLTWSNLWVHNLWELLSAGFRHSASLQARVILDGAACRLGELGDVRDVLGVLRILVYW